MTFNTFILVFPSDAMWLDVGHNPVMPMLDVGDECYTLDGNIAFIRTRIALENLTSRLMEGVFGDRQFFLGDITEADRAGTMMPKFWDHFPRETRQVQAA